MNHLCILLFFYYLESHISLLIGRTKKKVTRHLSRIIGLYRRLLLKFRKTLVLLFTQLTRPCLSHAQGQQPSFAAVPISPMNNPSRDKIPKPRTRVEIRFRSSELCLGDEGPSNAHSTSRRQQVAPPSNHKGGNPTSKGDRVDRKEGEKENILEILTQ